MEELNQIKCPACSTKIAEDAEFCPNCKVEFYNCSACNALVLGTDKVCRNCNADLDTKKENIAENKVDFAQPIYEYKPLEVFTNFLIILLSANIFFAVINIYSDVSDISFMNSNSDSGGVLYYDEESIESMVIGISAILYFISFYISFFFYLAWVRRAYRNLHTLQLKPTEFSSGWSIGAYFVPILNLFRPYTMMKEIWYGSQPIPSKENLYNTQLHLGLTSSSFLPLWWAAVIIDRIFSQLSLRLGLKAETYKQALNSLWFDLFSQFTGIAVCILLLYLIWTINKWQTEKHETKLIRECPYCGGKAELEALLCTNCGNKLMVSP